MRTLAELFGPAQFATFGQDWEYRTKRLTDRPGSEIYFVLHHSVSRTIAAIMAEFTSPNRVLSATVACGPDQAGVDKYRQIQAVPWNTGRPFTTSSWIDDQAITVEMANLALTPPWPVGATGKHWAAEVAAAMHVELGMPLDAVHVVDHQTVYQRGWGSYPTECCGADLRGDIPDILTEARQIVANAQNGDDMPDRVAFTDTRDRELPAGEWVNLYLDSVNKYVSLVKGKSKGTVSVVVQVSGLPVGEGLKVRFVKTARDTNVDIGGTSAREIPGTTGNTYAAVTDTFEIGDNEKLKVQVAVDGPGVTLLKSEISALVWAG